MYCILIEYFLSVFGLFFFLRLILFLLNDWWYFLFLLNVGDFLLRFLLGLMDGSFFLDLVFGKGEGDIF